MPKVSVIIPAYNPGKFIEEAVESVIRQSYTDWDLIVVDDGSTEDIVERLRNYPMVRYIRQQHAGASVARNTGITNSNGELIAFLDADDLWKPSKLALQVDLMDKESEMAFCYTQFVEIDAEGNEMNAGGIVRMTSYTDLLMGPCPISTTVMLRRSCLPAAGLFNPSYVISQDYDLWLRIAQQNKFNYILSVEALYRRHETNITTDVSLCKREVLEILDRHIKLAETTKDRAAMLAARKGMGLWRGHFGRTTFDVCRKSLSAGKLRPFAKNLTDALFLNPVYVSRAIWHWFMLRLGLTRKS